MVWFVLEEFLDDDKLLSFSWTIMESGISKKTALEHFVRLELRVMEKTQITVAVIALKSPHVVTGSCFGWELSAAAELSSIQSSISFIFILYFCLTRRRRHDSPFVKTSKPSLHERKAKVIFTSALLLRRFQKHLRLLKFWGWTVWLCLRNALWEFCFSRPVIHISCQLGWEPLSPREMHHHVVPSKDTERIRNHYRMRENIY